ncbi:hypothetical protein D3C71_1996370 [compost metagenome]
MEEFYPFEPHDERSDASTADNAENTGKRIDLAGKLARLTTAAGGHGSTAESRAMERRSHGDVNGHGPS